MATEQLTLDPERAQRLRDLAQEVRRSSDTLLQEAVDHYLEIQRWQLEDIKAGVAEADIGDFATTEEMKSMMDEFKSQQK